MSSQGGFGLKRIQLFEIEDQAWCPKIIRESVTDFLRALYKVLPLLQPAYEKIDEVLRKTQAQNIIDCCSGSGGPVEQLLQYLNDNTHNDVNITLTDKYPNQKAFGELEKKHAGRIIGYQKSVNATQIPADLKGLRTFFSCFHHFAPVDAKKILQDAVDQEAPIAIFETTQRHVVDFIRALISPILMLLLMPIARQMTWRKFCLSYMLPITPLVFMWDYLVSNLRTYSPKQLHSLVNSVHAPNYSWEIGKLYSKKAKTTVTYLVGYRHDK